MHPGDVDRFVRPQGRDENLGHQSRAGVEECQDPGHGEAAPRRLVGRLSEGALQRGRVRQAHAGAVGQPSAVSSPAVRIGEGFRGRDERIEQAFQQSQGPSGSGLAVGRRRKGPTGDSRQVGAGRVAVEDLQDEEVDGRDRIEGALPPRVTDLRTQLTKVRGGEYGGDVVANLIQG